MSNNSNYNSNRFNNTSPINTTVDSQLSKIDVLIQELWLLKRYIGVKLTENTIENLKKQT